MTATPANSRPLPLGQGKLSISRLASPSASSLSNAVTASSEPRRVAVPRHISSPPPQYGHSYFDDDDDDDSWWKNVVREQIDVQTLRDMAKFFRTTEPPSLLTRASIETQRDCFGAAVTLDNRRRWSLQSLRRANRKSHRKSDDVSLRFKLPDSAVPSTTLDGHEYVAISLPRENGIKDISHRNSIGLQLSSARQSARSGDLPASHQPAWPPRFESLSSNGGSGPSTPTSSSFKPRPSHLLKDELSEQEESDPASATGLDDRLSLSARDSSLRFYGTMLRLLGPSPAEEDENRNTPSGAVKEVEESKTAVLSTEHSQPAQPASNNQSEIRPATLRSAPSYSTIPKASISPNSSMHRHPGLHSRAGSSATTASKSTVHAREKSLSHAHTKSQPPEKASQPSPPLRQKHAQSPRSPPREKVKPGSLDVAHATRLHVPLQASNLMPGSPGFPAMLAAMSFPSPPESSPPTTSHGGVSPFGNSMPQSSPLASPGPETPKVAPAKTSTDQSEAATDDSRNSMASVTSVMTDATATDVTSNATVTTADVKDDDDSDSRSCLTRQTSNSHTSMSILDKKRARWSLLNEKPSLASLNDDEDVAAAAERKRLSRLSRSSFASIESGSTNTISTSTSHAASALAERRAARRQKIKEKIQRDLTVSTTSKVNKRNSNSDLKGLAGPAASGLSDAVDSPVLGYFPGGNAAPANSRVPGSRARLAQRSSIQRLAPLPDTSEEPHTQDDKKVAVNKDEQSNVSEGKEIPPKQDAPSVQPAADATPSSALCMSPIMVTASIEPELPLSTESSESEITTVRTSPTPTSSVSPSSSKADKRVRLADKQTLVPIKFSKAGLIDRAPSRLSVEAAARPDMVQQLRRSLAPLFTSGGTDAANNPDRDHPSPASAPVGDTGDSLLSSSDEHKWLQDHQRQSVQDWREAAQRERERIQQLAAEERNAAEGRARKSPVPFKLAGARAEISRRESLLLRRRTTGGFDPAWSAAVRVDGTGGDAAMTHDRDGMVWQPHTRSSSLTTWRRPSTIYPSRRFEQDFDSDRGFSKVRFHDDHHNTVMEQRVQRLERDRSDWVDVMMPLLENMNRLLAEVFQGGSTNGGGLSHERAAALRDSMHVIRSMGADFGKHTGMGKAEEPELAERVEEEEEEEAEAEEETGMLHAH